MISESKIRNLSGDDEPAILGIIVLGHLIETVDFGAGHRLLAPMTDFGDYL